MVISQWLVLQYLFESLSQLGRVEESEHYHVEDLPNHQYHWCIHKITSEYCSEKSAHAQLKEEQPKSSILSDWLAKDAPRFKLRWIHKHEVILIYEVLYRQILIE